jgi:hypothetical protein
MNEIRYWVHDWDTYSGGPPDGATPEQTPHYFEVVRASDFDALRAEVSRLRGIVQADLEEKAEAWGEVERLRAALAEMIEEAQNSGTWTKKGLARMRAVLSPRTGQEGT